MSTARTARLRRSLTLTTALVGGAVGIGLAAPTRAQSVLPSNASVDRGAVTFRSDGVPVVLPGTLNGTGTRLDVDIATPGSVVTWGDFSVGRIPGVNPGDPSTPNIVSFNNAIVGGGTAAIINRVTTGGPASDIRGSILSDPNVSVYLLNPNGITFGAGANVNVGALVAAALDNDGSTFTDLLGTSFDDSALRFAAAGATTGITVNNGTTFAIQPGAPADFGQLVLLGAFVQVDAGASLPAVTDAAFVAGTDITVTKTIGSPLAFTITTGTTVQNAITVGGSVSGRNVTLALASQDAITDAILNVTGTATATVASSTDRGVVLSAGQAVTGAVALSGTETGGVARIAGTDAASTITGQTFDDGDPATPPLGIPGAVTLAARNGIGYAGALAASGNVAVTGGGDVTLAGNVNAGGNYAVTSTAGAVTLGDTTNPRTQTAAGAVTIAAATGIAGRQRLTLTSNGDGSADGETTDVLRLTTTGAAAGINFDASSALVGGVAASATGRGLVNVTQADAAGAFALGNLTASSFNSTIAGTTVPGVSRTGAVSFGTVDLFNGFAATSTTSSVSVGGITVSGTGQGIALNAATTLTAPGTVSADGNVSLIGGNALNFTQVTSTSGSTLVRSTGAGATVGRFDSGTGATLDAQGGTAQLGTAIAGGGVAVSATGTAEVTGTVTASGGDYSVSGTSVTLGDAGSAPVTQRSNAAVTITATAAGGTITGRTGLTLTSNAENGGNEALTLASGTGGINFATGTQLNGSLNQTSDVIVGNADAPLALGGVTARGLIGSTGTRQISRSTAVTIGAINVAEALDLRTTGTATITTGTITATPAAASVSLTSGGQLTVPAITSGGTVTLTSTGSGVTSTNGVSAGGALTIGGGAIVLGGAMSANGAVSVTSSTSAGISGNADLVLTANADGAGAETLSLATTAAGAPISFAAGSAIVAGTTGDPSNIQITAADLASPLALGNVTGLGLLGQIGAGGFTTGVTRTGSLSFGTVNLRNSFVATSNAGNVTVGGVTVSNAGQGITLSAAAGAINAPATLGADGNVALTARDALTLGAATSTSGTTSLTTTGTTGDITATTVGGGTGVTIAANGPASVAVDTVNAGTGALSITGARLGGRNAGTRASLTAGGAVTVTLVNSGAAGFNTAQLGTVSGSSITIGNGADSVDLTSATSAGDISIQPNGALTFGTVAAGTDGSGTATLIAGSALTGTAASGGSGLTAQGLAATLGTGNSLNGAVALTATGGEARLGAADALTGVTVTGPAATFGTFVTGNVTVRGGGYTVTGSSVTLGDAAIPATQQATGAVTLTAQAAGMNVAGLGALTLTANSDGAGAEALTFAGGVNFGSGTQINGGPARQSDVIVGTADRTLTLGAVTARGIVAASGTRPITRSSAIAFGTLNLAESLSATATGGRSILTSGITISGAGQGLTLNASDLLTASGPYAIGGAVSGAGTNGVSVQTVTAGGTLALTSGSGSVSAGALTASDDVTVSAATAATTGTITATPTIADVSVTANSGALAVGGITAGGALTLSQTGIGTLTVSAASTSGGSVSLIGAGALRVAGATSTGGTSLARSIGGAVTGVAPTDRVSFASATGTTVQAQGGNALLGTVSASGGPVAITASTTADVNTVTASGAASVGGSTAVTFGSVSGSSATITGGVVNGTTAIGTGGVTIIGSAITLGTGTATAGNVALTSSAGAITLGSAAAGTIGGGGARDVTLDATGGGVTVTGAITAARDYTVRGTTVALGDDPDAETQAAGRDVSITATAAGGIVGGALLTLNSDADNSGGGNITLASAGPVNFAPSSTINTGVNPATGAPTRTGTLTITQSAGGGLTLGTVNAGSIVASGGSSDVILGNVNAVNGISITTTGLITAGTIDITGAGQGLTLAAGGPLSAQAINVVGNIALSSSGSTVTLTSVNSSTGTLSASASGALTGTTLAAQGNATVSGASVTLDTLTSRGGIASATANTGDLIATTITGLTGTSATATAGSVIVDTVTTTSGTASVQAGNAARGRSGAQLAVNSTNGAVQVSAGTANLSSATAGTSLSVVTTGGDLTLGTAQAGTTALARAQATTGDVFLTSLTAGGNATVMAGSDVRLGTARSTGGTLGVTATAGDVTGLDPATGRAQLTAAGALDVSAGGLARIGTAATTAGGTITVTAGTIDVLAATTTGSGGLTMTASAGPLTLGSGTIGGAASLSTTSPADITVTTLTTGSNLGVASGGAVRLGTLTAGGNASASGSAIVGIGVGVGGPGAIAATGSATVTGGGVTLGSVVAGTDATITGSTLTLATATANGGALRVVGSGDVGVTTATAGGSGEVRATGAGATVTLGTLTAGTTATVAAGANVRANTIAATGGALSVTASTGEVTGIDPAAGRATLASGGTATVGAGTLARLDGVTAGGDVAITAGTAVDAIVASGTDIALDGGAGTVSALTLTARDDIAIRAAGAVIGTNWTSGAATAADTAGVADTLAGGMLAGNDIDVAGASIAVPTIRARNTGGDIRLAGAVAPGADLDIDYGAAGAITLSGDAAARDVALNAGGAISTGAISARDDIVLRAGGAAVTGALTSGTSVGGLGAIDAAGAADALSGGALTANDIDIAAVSLVAARADAINAGSDLRAATSAGRLELTGGGSAGGSIALNASGSGDVVIGGLLTGGAVDGATILIQSAANVRLTEVTAPRGPITVSAGGELTGIGTGGRATLTAADPLADITASALSLARLGTATAGRDVIVAVGGATPAASALLDVTTATAGRDISAGGGAITAGSFIAGRDIAIRSATTLAATTLLAGDDIFLRATGAVTGSAWTSGAPGGIDEAGAADAAGDPLPGNVIDAQGGSIALAAVAANGTGSFVRLAANTGTLILGAGTAGGDLQLTSTGDMTVTGALTAGAAGPGGIGIVSRGGITLNTATATQDLAIDAGLGGAGNVTLAAASARDIAVRASAGSITAPTLVARDDILLRASGTITGSSWSSGATVDALGAVDEAGIADANGAPQSFAGNDIEAQAATITIGTIRAPGALSDVRLRGNVVGGTADGDLDIAAGAGILLTAQNGQPTGTTSARDVALSAGTSILTGAVNARDDIAMRAGNAITTGALTSGTSVGGLGPVDASGAADALLAGVDLSGNDIDLAGASVTVGRAQAIGAGSDVRIAGLVSGGADNDLDLESGGDLVLTQDVTARDVALSAAGLIRTGNITARDDIAIRAGGALTTGVLTSGATAAGLGAVDVAGAADALLPTVSFAGNDIDLRAASLSIPTAVAIGAGSDLRFVATAGTLSLGSGTAGGLATLTKQGGDGDLLILTALRSGATDAGGDLMLTSATNVRVAPVDATGAAVIESATGNVAVTAAGEVNGTGSDRASFRAAGAMTIAAGPLARLGTVTAGTNLAVTAVTIDAVTADAGGALSLAAGSGDVTLGTGGAGTIALVDAAQAANVGVLAAGGSATVRAGSVASVNTVRSTGANVAVSGASTGVGTAAAATTLALTASGGALSLGTGSAGGGATLLSPGATNVTGSLTAASATLTAGGATTVAALTTSSGAANLTAASASLGTLRVATTLGATTRTGDLVLADGTVGGAATLSSAGALGVTTALTAASATLGAAGAATIAALTTTTGGADLTAASASLGTLRTATTFTGTTRTGDLTLATGTVGGAASLTSAGALGITTALTAASATLNAGGASTVAALTTTTGGADLTAASAALGTLTTATTFAGTARTGDLSLASGATGGAASFTTGGSGDISVATLSAGGRAAFTSASDARLGDITARTGDVVVTATAGEVTGLGTGNANLRATAGQIMVAGGTLARLGTVDAGTAIDIAADTVSANTATARGGMLRTIARTGALTIGTGSATTTATLTATAGAGSVGTLNAGGAAVLTAGGAFNVTGTATTGTTFDLTAGGASSVGTLAAGSAATITTGTSASLTGATVGTTFTISAGTTAAVGTGGIRVGGTAPTAANTLVIRSTDLELGGTGTPRAGTVSAGRVTLIDRSATGTMRLGDNSGAAAGYALGDAELDLIVTPTLTFDATAGTSGHNVAIGTLSLTDAAGSARIDVLTPARIDIAGTISGAGAGSTSRILRLGGTNTVTGTAPNLVPSTTPVDTSLAALLVATTTADAGGRILLTGNTMVDLRANRIAFGQAAGFLTPLALTGTGTGADFQTVANQYISQPASTLYNAQGIVLGGGATSTTAYTQPNILTASTLSVRYGDYALFQNTGTPTSANPTTGIVVNSLQTPTISLTSQGGTSGASGQNGLALFGIINDRMGNGAALLGGSVILTSGINPANSRINGCLIGSGGGGCLISAVTPPQINVFDTSQANVFRTADDLAVQFDPIVGTNNESLFSDLGAIDFQYDEVQCDPASDAACAKDGATQQ